MGYLVPGMSHDPPYSTDGAKESFLLPNTDGSHGDKKGSGLGLQSALLPAKAPFLTQRSNTSPGAVREERRPGWWQSSLACHSGHRLLYPQGLEFPVALKPRGPSRCPSSLVAQTFYVQLFSTDSFPSM